MKKLQFSIDINAPKEKVWNTLWDDASYRQWTSAFNPSSYAVSDWKEGSRILFLAEGGDGMYSKIDRLIPNEYMSFRHLGIIKDGKEVPPGDAGMQWSDAFENYTLKENNGVTTVTVDLDGEEEYLDYFKETFPKALGKLKEIAEA